MKPSEDTESMLIANVKTAEHEINNPSLEQIQEEQQAILAMIVASVVFGLME